MTLTSSLQQYGFLISPASATTVTFHHLDAEYLNVSVVWNFFERFYGLPRLNSLAALNLFRSICSLPLLGG
jgi:hypothetical protein